MIYFIQEIDNFNLDLSSINKIYKKLCLRHHPDKGGNEEIFKEINNVHKEILKNPKIINDYYKKPNRSNQNKSSCEEAKQKRKEMKIQRRKEAELKSKIKKYEKEVYGW